MPDQFQARLNCDTFFPVEDAFNGDRADHFKVVGLRNLAKTSKH